MSQCPFWSTATDKFNCYSECPMQGSSDDNECLFREVNQFNKINIKDILKGDSSYKTDDIYEDNMEILSNF